jgi:DNA transformation protein and related proteins
MTAPSHEFESFVIDQLDMQVSVGRFFGGRYLKRDGAQFAIMMGNTLYFRTQPDDREAFESSGGRPFSYQTRRGRVEVRKYYSVPDEWLEDTALLRQWANRAITGKF